MRAQPVPQPAVPGVVRFYNFLPAGDPFRRDVLAGLAQPQKSIAPKYFYDERGRRLRAEVCALPEHYPARMQTAILRAQLGEIAQLAGPAVQLIEFGGGAGSDTAMLIETLQPSLYVPVDPDAVALRVLADELSAQFPWLNISGICADCDRPLALPEFVGIPIRRKVAFIGDAALGRFTPNAAFALIERARRLVGTGGVLLAGVDLKKDRKTLEAAYDDPRGVVAEFHRNLLARINRELGGDIQEKRFRHRASYDPVQGWVELHLESQFAHVGGRRFDFAAGEKIFTGIACKHTVGEFQELGKNAGFTPEKAWTDPAQSFSVHGMLAI